MERAADVPGRALRVARVGVLERVRIDRDRGVDARVVQRDARQIRRDQLPRRQPMLRHRLLHRRDGRLDDVEGRGAGGAPRGLRGDASGGCRGTDETDETGERRALEHDHLGAGLYAHPPASGSPAANRFFPRLVY